ncbi:hypothetical protein WR25_16557 [Diploscapter pachys]|uniref:Uncharacterized protein n=1 Tax=Diploscapter pachys TaxID=2018661 RepID=A0A2A2K8P0_9BILA|nr:hypothetical protein WR25_16557 [Diploscapter pachys]
MIWFASAWACARIVAASASAALAFASYSPRSRSASARSALASSSWARTPAICLSRLAAIFAGTFTISMPISTTSAAIPTQPVVFRPSAFGSST